MVLRFMFIKKENHQKIIGYDNNKKAVVSAIINVQRAGLEKLIHIEKREFSNCFPPNGSKKNAVGLVALNPPYGGRLGETTKLVSLYHEFGEIFQERFQGWEIAVLTSNKELASYIRLKARKINKLYNGGIECYLYLFNIYTRNEKKESSRRKNRRIKGG